MSDRLSSDLQRLRIERAAARPGPRLAPVLGAALASSLVSGLGGAALARRASAPPAERASARASVSGETREAGEAGAALAPSFTATGHAVALRSAKVGSRASGRVSRSHCREGQSVRSGELLFEIDDGGRKSEALAARFRVKAAEARAQAARASLGELLLQASRERTLADQGATPRATADDLQARLLTLRASLDAASAEVDARRAEASQAHTALDDLKVTAPFDGVVASRPAEVGEVAQPGAVLAELLDPSSLVLEVDVPEARLGALRPGSSCVATLDARPGERLAGRVTEVGPRVSRSKATGLARVRLDAPPDALREGMEARVQFLAEAVVSNKAPR